MVVLPTVLELPTYIALYYAATLLFKVALIMFGIRVMSIPVNHSSIWVSTGHVLNKVLDIGKPRPFL